MFTAESAEFFWFGVGDPGNSVSSVLSVVMWALDPRGGEDDDGVVGVLDVETLPARVAGILRRP